MLKENKIVLKTISDFCEKELNKLILKHSQVDHYAFVEYIINLAFVNRNYKNALYQFYKNKETIENVLFNVCCRVLTQRKIYPSFN